MKIKILRHPKIKTSKYHICTPIFAEKTLQNIPTTWQFTNCNSMHFWFSPQLHWPHRWHPQHAGDLVYQLCLLPLFLQWPCNHFHLLSLSTRGVHLVSSGGPPSWWRPPDSHSPLAWMMCYGNRLSRYSCYLMCLRPLCVDDLLWYHGFLEEPANHRKKNKLYPNRMGDMNLIKNYLNKTPKVRYLIKQFGWKEQERFRSWRPRILWMTHQCIV